VARHGAGAAAAGAGARGRGAAGGHPRAGGHGARVPARPGADRRGVRRAPAGAARRDGAYARAGLPARGVLQLPRADRQQPAAVRAAGGAAAGERGGGGGGRRHPRRVGGRPGGLRRVLGARARRAERAGGRAAGQPAAGAVPGRRRGGARGAAPAGAELHRPPGDAVCAVPAAAGRHRQARAAGRRAAAQRRRQGARRAGRDRRPHGRRRRRAPHPPDQPAPEPARRRARQPGAGQPGAAPGQGGRAVCAGDRRARARLSVRQLAYCCRRGARGPRKGRVAVCGRRPHYPHFHARRRSAAARVVGRAGRHPRGPAPAAGWRPAPGAAAPLVELVDCQGAASHIVVLGGHHHHHHHHRLRSPSRRPSRRRARCWPAAGFLAHWVPLALPHAAGCVRGGARPVAGRHCAAHLRAADPGRGLHRAALA
ncbi:hypothetical protein GGF38_004726, partial [Coemansia sp. RSA 25]